MTTSRGDRHGAAATALGACLLLTACTDASAPTRTPTPEPTATATPTTSPTPTPTTDVTVAPQRPEAMATPSADGAAAAASYFISLFPYINATGDLVEWNALSSPECTFCAGVRTNVEELHTQGNRNLGGAEILSATGTEVDAGRWYSARLHVVIAPSVDVDASGTLLDEHPKEDRQIDVVMTWQDGWTIDEVGPAAVPQT